MSITINGTSGITSPNSDRYINGFRLTLTSGTPVTTADVTGATTIYCTPYKGNLISLYDGAEWNVRETAEFSRALGTLTSAKPYDVFCYDNAGTPTLEFLAWTDDTTRATALAYQDGVLVKSGSATRRYLGTFYTTAATTTEDSVANRYLWNYYNRALRKMQVLDATASWTYTTATWRQARASTANQINFVIGVQEDVVLASVRHLSSNSTGNVPTLVGICLDATNTADAPAIGSQLASTINHQSIEASAPFFISAGKHFLAWVENSVATGTTTWTSNGTCGISGSVQA